MGQIVAGTFFSGMINDLVGIALFYNKALIHEDQLVCNIPSEGHFVCHNDHGGALLGKISDDPQYLSRKLGVQG